MAIQKGDLVIVTKCCSDDDPCGDCDSVVGATGVLISKDGPGAAHPYEIEFDDADQRPNYDDREWVHRVEVLRKPPKFRTVNSANKWLAKKQ